MPETHLEAWPTEADDEAIDELVRRLGKRPKARVAAAMLTVHLARSVLSLRGTLANIDERLRKIGDRADALERLNTSVLLLTPLVRELVTALYPAKKRRKPRRRGKRT